MPRKNTPAKQIYAKARKRLADYLRRARKQGYTIKTKLPPIVQRATALSTQKINKLLEEAKEEKAVQKEEKLKHERLVNKYKNMPARDLAYTVATKSASFKLDRRTGEIMDVVERTQPQSRIDTAEHIIQTSVYDWTRTGTQTEFTERIEYFIERCVGEYGKEVVAKALEVMAESGNTLTRMERYNNDYAHDWIAEILEVMRQVAYESRVRESDAKTTTIRKEFEELFLLANEDNFNGQLDAEVYEERYTGKFRNISKTPWRYK